MTSETANTAGTLRNRRISSLHSLWSLDDVAQRRRPDFNDPIYCLRHFNRCARWIGRLGDGRAGWVRDATAAVIHRGIRACTAVPILSARAFSSEGETGSRKENASNQESRAPLRFYRSGKGSGEPSLDQPVEPIGFTILIC
jgi:hypothetical protein